MPSYCRWCGKPIDYNQSVNYDRSGFCSNRCKSAYQKDKEEKYIMEYGQGGKSRGCIKVLVIIIAVVLGFAALCGVFSNGEIEDVNTSSTVQTNHSDVVHITELPTTQPISESITETESEVEPESDPEIDKSAIEYEYETETETSTADRTNKSILVFETLHFTVKVVNNNGENIYYYAWNKGKELSDTPSLQLSNGKYDSDNNLFIFENEG